MNIFTQPFFSIAFVLVLLLASAHPSRLSAQGSVADPPELREAKKSYSQKKYDTAIKQFSAYGEKHPNDGTPFLYLGYIYESRKDFPKSIANFKRAVEGNLSKSQKSTTLLKLALYFNYYQEWEQAAVYASRYLKMNPGNKEVEKIQERALANRGRAPIRYSTSTQTTAATPTQTQTQSTDTQPAKKTKAEYEAILKQDPNDEEARWELSLLAFNDKDYASAEALMKPLVVNHSTKPSYSYKLGVTQIRRDKYLEAVENFQLTKKNIPKDDKTFQYFLYLNEGIALYKLNRLTEAEAAFLNSSKMSDKVAPLIGLVRVYHDLTKWEFCIDTSSRVLKLTPDNLEIQMYQALCKFEPPVRDAGPIFQFEKLLRAQHPSAASIPENYYPGMIKLAREYTNTEKYKNAEEYYLVLESKYSGDREFLFYRGKSLYYTNQPSKAIQYLSQVERSSAAIYLLAKCYAAMGNQPKTEESLARAGEQKPIYWDLAKEEADFAEMRKRTSFMRFLQAKGGRLPEVEPKLKSGSDAKTDTAPAPNSNPQGDPIAKPPNDSEGKSEDGKDPKQ